MLADKTCRTQEDLARALGTTQATISRCAKRPDWPAKRVGPWSADEVEEIRQWRQTLREDRTRIGRNATSSKIRLAQAQADLYEAKVEQLRARYTDKSTVSDVLCGFAYLVLTAIDRLEQRLNATLIGLDAATGELVVRDQIDAVRRELAAVAEIPLMSYADLIKNGSLPQDPRVRQSKVAPINDPVI